MTYVSDGTMPYISDGTMPYISDDTMTYISNDAEFSIKAFERRHRRSSFPADAIIDAYNSVGGMSPALDKFMRLLSGGPSDRAEKKVEDKKEQFVCSVLIDRSPVMSAGWSDLLNGVNKMADKLKKFDGTMHYSLALLDRSRENVQEFENKPRKLSVDTPLGEGDFAMYDRLIKELDKVLKYIRTKKLRRPKVRIVVFSKTKDTVSKYRTATVREIVKRAAKNGVIVRFAYGDEDSEMVADRIGAVYKPLVTPKKPVLDTFMWE